MSDNRLFLLDGHALVYRAHFAFIGRPLTNSKGVDTSAATGFTRALWDLIRTEKPIHLAATPNPAHGQVLFSYNLNDQIGGGYHLVVSDLWGRTVYTVPLSGATSGQHTWYPHQTPAGVYLYRLTQRGQTVVTPQRISILAH